MNIKTNRRDLLVGSSTAALLSAAPIQAASETVNGTTRLDYHWPKIDRPALVAKHRARVRAYMEDNEIDLLLLNEFETIHSLMGVSCMKFPDMDKGFAFLVDKDFKGFFFSIFYGGLEPTAFEYPGVEGVQTLAIGENAYNLDSFASNIITVIRDKTAKRVGLDRGLLGMNLELVRRLPDVDLVPVDMDLRALREIKFPEEIAELEVAANICARGHALGMEQLRVGMTDSELSAIAAHYYMLHGAMYPSNLYNLHGPHLPSWGVLNRPLEDGDVITIDYGLYSKIGLQADLGRTVWVGAPDPKFVDQYVKYAEAVQDIFGHAVKPGMDKIELAETIRSGLRKFGLSDQFTMIGHGTGYLLSEPPTMDVSPVGMNTGEPGLLKPGQVICFEPMILENYRGQPTIMQAEDMYVVEETGLRKLSTDCGYMGIDY